MKQFICTGTWKRHTKGDVITEQEYNRMPIEAKTHNYTELILSQSIEIQAPEPEKIMQNDDLEVEIPVGEFTKPPESFNPKKKLFSAEK